MERAFVIPSYDRPLELKTKTLATLKRHGIDKENIWVFVANDNELKKYEIQKHIKKLKLVRKVLEINENILVNFLKLIFILFLWMTILKNFILD